MKIAMPYLDGKVNPHFGASREFVVINAENGKVTGKKIIKNEAMHNHGGLAQLLKAEGAGVVITGGIGKPMAQSLLHAGFKVIAGASGDVEQVAGEYLNSTLVTSQTGCDCGGDHSH